MPVWKYRSIEEMPDARTLFRDVPTGRRMRALAAMGRFVEGLNMPRGVTKYRSHDEARADRERYERARITRISDRKAK